MADKQHRPATARDFPDLTEAFFLKLSVPDSEHFVDDQDFRLEMRGDREGKAYIHTRRIALNRRVQETLDLGERHDFIELPVDLRPCHAEDRAVEIDVLPP